MSNKEHDNKSYTAADIQQYLDGEMSAQQMHAMEKAALEDPFLADAIDGYARYDKAENQKNIAILYKQLNDTSSTVIPFHKKTWYRIAASVILLAGGLSVAYMLLNNNDNRQLAMNEKKAALPLTDTINTSVPLPVPAESLVRPAPPLQEAMADRLSEEKDAALPRENTAQELAPIDNTRAIPEPAKAAAAAPPAPVISSSDKSATISGKAPGLKVEMNASRRKQDINKENELVIQDTASMDDIIVIGYGTQKKRTYTGAVTSIKYQLTDTSEAAPVNGLQAFRNYIDASKKIPSGQENMHGTALIKFRVKRSGKTHDFKIIKSLSAPLDGEAIRLLKEGPRWIRKKPGASVTVEITF